MPITTMVYCLTFSSLRDVSLEAVHFRVELTQEESTHSYACVPQYSLKKRIDCI